MDTRMTKVTKQVILGKEVTILGSIEEPLFRAKDVCDWLKETNPSQTLARIPDELKDACVKKIKCRNGATSTWVNYLTETGVYYVLMRSRSKEAIKYQMKIADILKSIRLKGYAVSENITNDQIDMLKSDIEQKETLLKIQGNVIRKNDRFISALKQLIQIYEKDPQSIIQIENIF